ncbi:hypothetical protein F5884DRAFT_129412 [Xylogone sp. PMI_703]|nr:hypothetical protein F5884DRAFT_129412 [Xylogone sp. PMI_703]
MKWSLLTPFMFPLVLSQGTYDFFPESSCQGNLVTQDIFQSLGCFPLGSPVPSARLESASSNAEVCFATDCSSCVIIEPGDCISTDPSNLQIVVINLF